MRRLISCHRWKLSVGGEADYVYLGTDGKK